MPVCACPVCDRQLKRCMAEDIVKDIMGDSHVIEELEKEWEQLQEDRQALRQVFPTGDSKVGASTSPSTPLHLQSRNRYIVLQMSTDG